MSLHVQVTFWMTGKGTYANNSDLSLPPDTRPLVLVVEDNPIQQRISVAYAEKLGAEVHAAASCKEAIQLMERYTYALVLMDWRMPEVDGLACTKCVREVDEAKGQHTPIVALTARALTGDRDKCIAAGMDDYLSKPFTVAQLREVFGRWIPDEFDA